MPHHVRIAGLLSICALVVLVGAFPALAQSGYTPRITWSACPFPVPEGETERVTLDCGSLSVPQDRSEPDGPWIDLAFVVLYATSRDPLDDPLLYLEGGPGGSALAWVDGWVESPYRKARDIILLDQRGTGYSFPRLYCWEWDEIVFDESMSQADVDAADAAALAKCQARLAADYDVDLGDYNSAAGAADVADLRQALRVDTWNIYSISYGTRVALTVLRDHPEGVRSVVLDSTYPPDVDGFEGYALSADRSFGLMFEACAAEPACSAAYPDLEARFLKLVDQFNKVPLILEEAGEVFWGEDLVNLMFDLFYNAETVPYMPLMIDELERGKTTTLLTLYNGLLPGVDGYYDDDPVYLFADEFYALIDTLDDATYTALEKALIALEPFTREGLTAIITQSFTFKDARYLLALLHDVPDDDLLRLEYELFAEDVSDSIGTFDAVECYEEVPFNDYAEAEALAADVPPQIAGPLLYSLEAQQWSCDNWPTGSAPAIEDQPVSSAVPALILAGEYDPITPPAWGAQAAQTLSNSHMVMFPGVGHAVIESSDCATAITLAFLADPATAPDSSCAAALGLPAFALPPHSLLDKPTSTNLE